MSKSRRTAALIIGKHIVPISTLDTEDRTKLVTAVGRILVAADGAPTPGPIEGARFWVYASARYEATLALVESEMQHALDRLTKENADLRQTNLSLSALVDRDTPPGTPP